MIKLDNKNLIVLAVVAAVILSSIIYLEIRKPNRLTNLPSGGAVVETDDSLTPQDRQEKKAQQYDLAREIVAPAGFINTDKITIQELIGQKVILLDFWTYSCINCQRTLPYITTWYEKYKDKGLEIIGIHTPEFEFEKKLENVQRAVDRWGINYPVVLDNDYGTWTNYNNRYWPRKYLIDIDGYVIYDHIGEGAYEETERKIQQLLEERRIALSQQIEIDQEITKPDNVEEVDFSISRSPEVYFGASRNTRLGNGISNKTGIQDFSEPSSPKANTLYLVGSWDIEDEFAQNSQAGNKIIFRYQGEKVFMVARSDDPVQLTILRDGEPISDAGGSDVKNSQITVQEDRLYRLVEDPRGYGEHTLEIIIEGSGLQAFTFTFG